MMKEVICVANKKFTNPINRGRIVANKFEVIDVTGNEKIIKDITSNVNVKGTKLDADFFTELQKGLVFTVDTVHSVESGVDIYTLSLDGLSGASNTDGFPLFPGLSLNVKIDISNTETASKIRISGSDYTFLTENGNTYTALNVGSLIKNNYYKIIFNGNEFILSDTTKATETTAGIITEARIKEISKALDPIQATEFVAGIVKIATTSEVAAGINNLSAVTPEKLKSLFVDGLNTSVNGYQKFPSGIIFQWGSVLFTGLPDAPLSSGSDTQVYFPIVFPNNCFVINVNGSGDVGNEGVESSHSYYNKTKSGFVHRAIRLQGNNGDGTEKGTAGWRAIGY